MSRVYALLAFGLLAALAGAPGATATGCGSLNYPYQWACDQCPGTVGGSLNTACKSCMQSQAPLGRAWVCLTCARTSSGSLVTSSYFSTCSSTCAQNANIPGWWCQKLTDFCRSFPSDCLQCFSAGGDNVVDACTACAGLSVGRSNCFTCVKNAAVQGVAGTVAYRCDECGSSTLCRRCLVDFPNKQDLCVNCRTSANFNTCAGTSY